MLTLEDYVRETFRVDIQPKGQAAEGFYVSNMTVRPNLLQIAGSKKQIDRIEKVVVEVDTTGRPLTSAVLPLSISLIFPCSCRALSFSTATGIFSIVTDI